MSNFKFGCAALSAQAGARDRMDRTESSACVVACVWRQTKSQFRQKFQTKRKSLYTFRRPVRRPTHVTPMRHVRNNSAFACNARNSEEKDNPMAPRTHDKSYFVTRPGDVESANFEKQSKAYVLRISVVILNKASKQV